MVFHLQAQSFGGRLGLQRLGRDARGRAGRFLIRLGAALGTGVGTAAKFDSDEKRTFRVAGETGPPGGLYRALQGYG
jgi:hypothetical protein